MVLLPCLPVTSWVGLRHGSASLSAWSVVIIIARVSVFSQEVDSMVGAPMEAVRKGFRRSATSSVRSGEGLT